MLNERLEIHAQRLLQNKSGLVTAARNLGPKIQGIAARLAPKFTSTSHATGVSKICRHYKIIGAHCSFTSSTAGVTLDPFCASNTKHTPATTAYAKRAAKNHR
eukprot:1159026-Pelagomonas_calceolata.AAC.7